MIRRTLRGLWEMGRVLVPIAAAIAPPIAGSFLLEPVLWLGILILCLWVAGLVLATAYLIGKGVE